MVAVVMPEGKQSFTNSAGAPLAGGKVYTYDAGTNTPRQTFADAAGLVPNANPVILDARGEATIFWDGNYKVVLRDASDALIYTVDGVATPETAGSAAALRADLLNYVDAAKGAGMSGYSYLLNYGANTIGYKLKERVSARDFGAIPGITYAQMLAALSTAWAYCLANGVDLYLPAGIYDTGDNSMPWRQQGAVVALLDCNDITIYGDGPATVLKTTSTAGADVCQLNGLKNFHMRNLSITGALTGFAGSGSNGISVTGGYDNISILDVWVYDMPSLDKGASVDGGKALTLQSDAAVTEVGSLRARIYAKGCFQGFGFEAGLVNFLTKSVTVNVDIVAEDCFAAVSLGAPEATGPITLDITNGVRVRGQSINCQKALMLARAYGPLVDLQIITTKTPAQRRLSPSGATWWATQTEVEALFCAYAKRGEIRLHGYLAACDYKARIGGAGAGAAGHAGTTEGTVFDLDLGGTAATADLLAVNFGGNTVSAITIRATAQTCSSFPADFIVASLKNRLQIGSIYTGSFTATLTGCTTAPTGVVNWSMEGDIVTLDIPTIAATSNSVSATLTGMPAEIRPQSPKVVVGRTTNNGADTISMIDIDSSGVITLYNGVTFTFTNVGTKGTKQFTVSYRRPT